MHGRGTNAGLLNRSAAIASIFLSLLPPRPSTASRSDDVTASEDGARGLNEEADGRRRLVTVADVRK